MESVLYWTGAATWIVLAVVGLNAVGAWLIEWFLTAANLNRLFLQWQAERLRKRNPSPL